MDTLTVHFFNRTMASAEQPKTKKKTVPKVVRDLAWNRWIGEDVAKHKCMSCEINEIRMNSFHCGHVIAEANGGKTSVDNLRPICSACNLSMGTENMDDFKARCGFGAALVPAGSAAKLVEPVPWYPGILRQTPMPPRIKWYPGTNSLDCMRELAGLYTRDHEGVYVLNRR
jgi:hypothetical protein